MQSFLLYDAQNKRLAPQVVLNCSPTSSLAMLSSQAISYGRWEPYPTHLECLTTFSLLLTCRMRPQQLFCRSQSVTGPLEHGELLSCVLWEVIVWRWCLLKVSSACLLRLLPLIPSRNRRSIDFFSTPASFEAVVTVSCARNYSKFIYANIHWQNLIYV